MQIISFLGWSQSGKTTLICKLCNHIQKAGKKVAILKNIHCQYSLQPDGKDSKKFLEAGAQKVFLKTPKEFVNISTSTSKNILSQIKSDPSINQFDYLFCEGLVLKESIVIEVFQQTEVNQALKYKTQKIDCVVSDNFKPKEMKVFKRDEIKKISNFITGGKI